MDEERNSISHGPTKPFNPKPKRVPYQPSAMKATLEQMEKALEHSDTLCPNCNGNGDLLVRRRDDDEIITCPLCLGTGLGIDQPTQEVSVSSSPDDTTITVTSLPDTEPANTPGNTSEEEQELRERLISFIIRQLHEKPTDVLLTMAQTHLTVHKG